MTLPVVAKLPVFAKLTVIATLDAPPEELTALAPAVQALARASQAEAGCLSYQVWRAQDPPRLVFHEVWRDAAAWQVHRSAPALAQFRAAIKGRAVQVWASPAEAV